MVAKDADHTTLHIEWILISRAMAYQLSHEPDFFNIVKRVGFKKVVISDGYDQSWGWDLD